MSTNEEQKLAGGQNTDVVKVGDTVRRTLGSNADYVHKVLQMLERKNHPYSPRYLGMDAHGREILSYIDGEIGGSIEWTDYQLEKVMQMLRDFHDSTTGSELCRGQEVICHRDIAPWNTVLRSDIPVAFIDYDGVEPGSRVEDLGYALWTFLELGNPNVDITKQALKVKLMVESYGFTGYDLLIDAIIKEQHRVLDIRKKMAISGKDHDVQEFSKERVKVIEDEINWVKTNMQSLIDRADLN